jgi:hypothetical protein
LALTKFGKAYLGHKPNQLVILPQCCAIVLILSKLGFFIFLNLFDFKNKYFQKLFLKSGLSACWRDNNTDTPPVAAVYIFRVHLIPSIALPIFNQICYSKKKLVPIVNIYFNVKEYNSVIQYLYSAVLLIGPPFAAAVQPRPSRSAALIN